jgi:hypothetical protein
MCLNSKIENYESLKTPRKRDRHTCWMKSVLCREAVVGLHGVGAILLTLTKSA